ncbi:IS4 family transposase [Haloimpatiens massiliensis]|uniref:IS4 family transposase n=1 Tax=Haloimpatiens massiliensis TaxID=1658110 RepID=UPI000C8664C5|nr:transposase [Haloimpatiens massiliensis]
MNTIISNDTTDKQLNFTINRFFKDNKIGYILKQCNFSKEKGFSCIKIFKYIFMLVFTGKNLFRNLEFGKNNQFSKDTIYRFLNSPNFNWRKFLFLLSSSIIKNIIVPLTSEDRVNVLVVDDSLYSRSRSKSVELLARVRDHVDHKYIKGFRLLTLGWSDGNTFLPLAFTLLSSEKEKNRLCSENHNIDKRTNGSKLRKEAILKSPEVMISLLKQVSKYAIPASYVLFDSWFTYPKTLIQILELKLNTIAMVKAMPRVYYNYNGKLLNLKDLYAALRKRRGKAKILSSAIVGIGSDKNGNEVKAKIVFVRDRNRSRKWLALISTNISLDDNEIVRIYGKRWDIEVFFKMNKSFLKLAKEFQGRSYDSMVSHTSIVFTRYIMLTLESRKNNDVRTIGGFFYQCCDELQDVKFCEVMNLIIDILKNVLTEKLLLSKDIIDSIIDSFIAALPCYIKEKLVFLSCES